MSSLAQRGVESSEAQEIVIIRRGSRRRARRHGGAWKVALADFVTAMMALFMVLWLWQTGDETQQAVASYFQDPNSPKPIAKAGPQQATEKGLTELASAIKQSMRNMPELRAMADYISVSETAEGLRIELLENEAGMFFQTGSPSPTGIGAETLGVIAGELKSVPNELIIEGHTDSRPFSGRNDYSNWDLSTDRANSARRLLITDGVATNKIVQVRGFADVKLRKPNAPEDPSNRRVSIIVLDR